MTASTGVSCDPVDLDACRADTEVTFPGTVRKDARVNAEAAAPRAGERRKRWHPFQPIALALSVLTIGASFVAVAGIWRYGGHEQYLGWSSSPSDRNIVDAITPGGPADGRLQPGDRIVAMDGDSRVAVLGTYWKRKFLQPGHPYTLDVVRYGATRHVSLGWRLVDSNRQWVLTVWVLIGLAWSGFGLFVGLASPSTRAARLWALAGLSIGLNFFRLALRLMLPQLEPTSAALFALLELNAAFVVTLAFHAMYRFPPGAPSGRFWSAVLVVAYGIAIFSIQDAVATSARWVLDADMAAAIATAVGKLGIKRWFYDATDAVVLVLAAAVAVRNFRWVDDADQRRRVRWIVAAIAIGVVPEGLVQILSDRTSVAADLLSLAIPAAFTYAIVQHRVFDVSVAVRIGLQYLLARNALRIVIALPVVAMVFLIASNPDLTIRQVAVDHPAYPLLAATAAGMLAFQRRLIVAIDRRFFRDAYDRERLLESLLDDVDNLYIDEDGLQRVVDRLETALHPTTVVVWLREHDRERMRLSVTRGGAGAVDAELWLLPSRFVHEVEHHPKAMHVSGLRPPMLDQDMQRLLESVGLELLVPMVGYDSRLRGLLGLGPKRADEPYAPGDLQLLERITRQLAVVREHIELRTRVTEEQTIRKHVLEHLGPTGVGLLKECPACGRCYSSEQQHCELDNHQLKLSLPVERTVAGRYRLDRLVGRGGMGTVYRAFDVSLHRVVAVKIMIGRNFGNEMALRRFDREARAVARLSHPNIVAVFDYGRLAGDGAFLVMEYIDGRTLRDELGQRRYPPRDAGQWVAQILDGVASAHAHGIIHRDLKPENVLITAESGSAGRIKLLDFGLARQDPSAGADTLTASQPGLMLGTLAYMAPEQLLGKPVDQRADIFALGVMVIEVLTGERPFSSDPLRRLRDVQEGVSSQMIPNQNARSVLARCVAMNPDDRYPAVDVARSDILLAVSLCMNQSENHTT